VTRTLLLCGAIAGPIYILVVAVQVLARDGFDITRHPVSVLSIGDFGWVQILNFVVVGGLVLASAFGLRRLLGSGPGHVWGPILIGIFGIGMIASGVFVADPVDGFPPGTPAGDPSEVSFSGVMHFAAGGIAFLSISAACLVFARRFVSQGETGIALFSAATGVFYLLSFATVAATSGSVTGNIMLTVAVTLGWLWLSMVTLRVASLLPSGRRAAMTAGA
jgi:hypothetical protein